MLSTLRHRFGQKYEVDLNTGCWNWTAHINRDGYGMIRVSREHGLGSSHRVSYKLFRGVIPEGLELDHLCRNRACCNPEHLEPVTKRENQRRGLQNQNTTKTHCPKDHPLSGVNLYERNGRRHCRACRAENDRQRRVARRRTA